MLCCRRGNSDHAHQEIYVYIYKHILRSIQDPPPDVAMMSELEKWRKGVIEEKYCCCCKRYKMRCDNFFCNSTVRREFNVM